MINNILIIIFKIVMIPLVTIALCFIASALILPWIIGLCKFLDWLEDKEMEKKREE